MNQYPLQVACLILVILLAGVLLAYLLASRFNFKRIQLGMRSEWRVLRDPAFAERVSALLTGSQEQLAPKRPSGVPLRLLALLQREGRLLDFLMEEIGPYEDAQIGAAVRQIHEKCQATLKEHMLLEPVLASAEGDAVELPAGFDPAAVRLTGNVTGQPPFHGTVKHHGWRVKELKLSEPPVGQDELILMPAEVELP
jgi:hypothetical protein